MNIFKILASGDGSINEPNVSAFLGYLLNPNQDHGLKGNLLKLFIENLIYENPDKKQWDFLRDKQLKVRDLSINSVFEFDVLLEQAFKSKDQNNGEYLSSKQIVDIVIICHKKEEKAKESKESLAQKILIGDQEVRELKQIFLIEIKIRDNSSKELQLDKQFENTRTVLENLINKREINSNDLISVIFITPMKLNSIKSFELFDNHHPQIAKAHFSWNSFEDEEDRDSKNVSKFFKELLNKEQIADIEAIPEYTKQTIKSFVNFIDNDFRSTIEEELEGVVYKPKVVFNTEDEFYDFQKNEKKIQDKVIELSKIVKYFILEKYKNKLVLRLSPTHFSFFLKELDFRNGSKFVTMDLQSSRIAIGFIKKNIETVPQEILEKGKSVSKWLTFYFDKFDENEKLELAKLLEVNYSSITNEI